MIKLDVSIYDDIKEEYFQEIVNKIRSLYKSKANKFFNTVEISDFFENDNCFDEEKVKNIIFMDFVDMRKNDEILRNYFCTGALIYYSNFKITHELERIGKRNRKEERYSYRQNYVEMYRNLWIEQYLIKYPNYYKGDKEFHAFIEDIAEEYKKMNKILENIITYSLIDSAMRRRIIIATGITVCPYCDRQYISYFMKDKVKYTTADLDHFYPKSKFPLFSLSLYNFVPSCQICNQRFKNKRTLKILYPFKDGFNNDAKFTLNFKDVDSFYGKSDCFDLKLSIKDNSSIKQSIINNNEMFQLESLYTHHKPYIKELLMKRKLIYNKAYLSLISNTFEQLNLTEDQLQIFLYGYNFNNPKQEKILGKLTSDILDILEEN